MFIIANALVDLFVRQKKKKKTLLTLDHADAKNVVTEINYIYPNLSVR